MFRLLLLYLLIMSMGAYPKYFMKAREAQRIQQEMEQNFMKGEQEAGNQKQDSYELNKQEKYELVINDSKKPEVVKVELTGVDGKEIVGNVRARDVYNIDVMASGTVGLVGAPVEITYGEELNGDVILTFYYNKDELRGIPERNLMVLTATHYDEVPNSVIDEEAGTVKVKISERGTYMLLDRYQWYSAWGADASEYAYEVDPSQYISDWEREAFAGDIMQIADIEWAKSTAPIFEVTTPEQLAGVVYYVNVLKPQSESVRIVLNNDVDLEGYHWASMGWGGSKYNSIEGEIDGKGHSIKNMSIPQSTYYNGFVGHSLGINIHDISFENAYVSGGFCGGIVCGNTLDSMKWENIKVSGRLSDIYGKKGAIVGDEVGIVFENCQAEVVYVEQDKEETLDYFSERQRILSNIEITEDFTLVLNADGSVTRDDLDLSNYDNLSWDVYAGIQILSRAAENELTLSAEYTSMGDQVWLSSYKDGAYVRVSNIIDLK